MYFYTVRKTKSLIKTGWLSRQKMNQTHSSNLDLVLSHNYLEIDTWSR